jgi:hypothetical protein
MRVPATSLLVFALALASAGCDDPSFITVETPDGSGAPVSDAGADGGAFDLAACESCFMTNCATDWAACDQPDSSCGANITCIENAGCFGRSQASFISCGLPCSGEVGLNAGSPGYTAIVNFFECVIGNSCDQVCFAK